MTWQMLFVFVMQALGLAPEKTKGAELISHAIINVFGSWERP